MRLGWIMIGLAAALSTAEVCAEVYRYTDQDGVIHFTDNYIEIPEDQRPKVETVLKPDESAAGRIEIESGAVEEVSPPGERTASGKPDESAAALQPAAAGGSLSQDHFETLIKAKAELDKIYESLASEKEALEKEQKSLKTLESIRAYQKKVNLFNQKLADYERQRQAFQARADAYNQTVAR